MSLRLTNFFTFLFLLFGLVLYLSPFPENPLTENIRKLSYYLFSPFLKLERELEEEVEKFILLYREMKRGTKVITLYHKQLEKEKVLEEELKGYREIMRKLERDLDLPFPRRVPYVISKIILYDPSGGDKFFIIRDGRNKGIEKGDLVVARGFVLGVVEEVYFSTSKVKSLFNEKCSLLAFLEGKDKAYVYKGGYPFGSLLYVDLEDPVEPGESVLYKDLTMRIPPFPIGEVAIISSSTNPFFKEVKVRPYLTPREAEFVVVFRNR